jgi:hypothetical protein
MFYILPSLPFLYNLDNLFFPCLPTLHSLGWVNGLPLPFISGLDHLTHLSIFSASGAQNLTIDVIPMILTLYPLDNYPCQMLPPILRLRSLSSLTTYLESTITIPSRPAHTKFPGSVPPSWPGPEVLRNVTIEGTKMYVSGTTILA